MSDTRTRLRPTARASRPAYSSSVDTLNGTVQLSGFAKNTTERSTAEDIARDTKGVKSVKNAIVVRS